MAVYDLEEQEQLAELKAWWKQYGNLVTGVLLAASVAVAGWQGWKWYQRNQGAQASGVFSVLERAAAAKDSAKVKAAAGELLEKFPRTEYAPLGALVAGRNAFEAGDLKTARAQLSWAVDHGDNEVRDLARLRLAAVLIDDKAYDEALKQLDAAHAAAFDPRFADLRGDVLAAQGKRAEARVAWLDAAAKLDATIKAATEGGAAQQVQTAAPFRDALQQKIDSVPETK